MINDKKSAFHTGNELANWQILLMILLPVEKQKLKGQSGVKYFGSLLLYYNYMQMLNYIHLTCIYRCDEINSSTYILFKLSLLDQHESKGRGEGTITSYYYKFGCAKYHKYYKTKGYHLKLYFQPKEMYKRTRDNMFRPLQCRSRQ